MLNKSEQQVVRIMKRARQIAREGVCKGWTDVLQQMIAEGHDVAPLKSMTHFAERRQIDALCDKARASVEAQSQN